MKIFSVDSSQTFNSITKLLDELTKVLLNFYEKISAILTDLYNQLDQAFKEKFLPALKSLYQQLEKVFFDLYEDTISLLGGVFERVSKALKGFEDDFNKISAAVSEMFKNLNAFSKEYLERFEKELKELYSKFLQQIQALPGVEALKEKINEVSWFEVRF